MTSRTRELTDSALLVSMLIVLALAPRDLPLWGLGMQGNLAGKRDADRRRL